MGHHVSPSKPKNINPKEFLLDARVISIDKDKCDSLYSSKHTEFEAWLHCTVGTNALRVMSKSPRFILPN